MSSDNGDFSIGIDPLDILSAFTEEPPELDFIWPGFLAGTVGALVAPGATGKSYWALEAVMSVATGVESADLVGLRPTQHGPVAFFAGEDPSAVAKRRFHAIGKHLDPQARSAVAENIRFFPVMGKQLDVTYQSWQDWIIDTCHGCRLIVFDTLSRIHNLDENNNGDMSRVVSILEYIASKTGAAVLYLHHISKGSAKEGAGDQQHAGRGASALVDNARWCGFVARMTEKESESLSDRRYDRKPIGEDGAHRYVRFGISKQNYDAPFLDRWYERCEGGVLKPIELVTEKGSRRRKGGLDDFSG